jgi:2-methylcitrate dehydratase PrpD
MERGEVAASAGGDPVSDAEARAAAFAADLRLADVPPGVQTHVGLVIADTVGAVVGGATDPAVGSLVDRLADEAAPQAPTAAVLGTASRLSPRLAALVTGTAGTVLELDEGHKYAAGHPAIHVFPAVLAAGDAMDATTEEFLTAFVAGYEVVTRVARACAPLTAGYHPHGVWGAVGAAVGVARLRGLDAETTLTAMRIAANGAQHTRMAAATEGATVRNSYAGKANLDGMLAVELAEAGFTGLVGGVARHLSPACGDGFDADELTRDLGERWDVTGGYFKRHAACRYTHPTLDALDALLEGVSFDADRVAEVDVETYPMAAELTAVRPTNALQAKFSIPFAVATRLLTGSSGKPSFDERARSAATFELAERVTVRAASDLTARLPDARSARVRVTLDDGQSYEEEVVHARGGAERPWAEAELREKFDELVGPVLGDDAADTLWPAVRERSVTPRELGVLASR